MEENIIKNMGSVAVVIIIIIGVLGFSFMICLSSINTKLGNIQKTVEKIETIVKKQNISEAALPVKDIKVTTHESGRCPICSKLVWTTDKRCPECGQKIKWDNEDKSKG